MMAIVSHRHGFAFVANPKTASTSIHAVLQEYQERPDLDALERKGYYTRRHVPASQLMEALGVETWKHLLTFAVVRNPFDWFVSQLAYNFRRLNMSVPVDRRLSREDVRSCLEILRNFRGSDESQYGSQWAFLCGEGRTPAIKLLLPYENLDSVWPSMAPRLGLSKTVRLPHLNASPHPDWDEWLSSSAKSLIEHVWEEDFRLYDQARLYRGPSHD